jgi:hypothetical protein
MLRVTKGKGETKKRSRFTGICADAHALGVSREHLFRVLTGERESRSLLRRYLELKQSGRTNAGSGLHAQSRDGQAGNATKPPASPIPAAVTETTSGRERRPISSADSPRSEAIAHEGGAGLYRTVKERSNRNIARRAPA